MASSPNSFSSPSSASGFTITSAYNFVPLQGTVVQPEWQDRSSQDVPLQDGFCAELDIVITNDTPLLVGGTRAQRQAGQSSSVEFHRHPDGRYAIPGSSLRGMVRNVVEIASNSQMYRLDDRKLSVRDLQNARLYTSQFTETTQTKPIEVTPLTRSAWMRFREGCWWLCHVPHVRVEHSDLKARLGLDLQGWFYIESDSTPHGKYDHVQNVFRQKTQALTPSGKPLQLFFSIEQAKVTEHLHQSRTLSISYPKVSDVSYRKEEGKRYGDGRLVVTGQPSKSKHMEFIFQVPNETKWFKLEDSLVQDFLRINDTPETMLERFKDEKTNPFGTEVGFPVFYLCKDRSQRNASASNDIRAIGLAQMFRLPYTLSLGQAAQQQQPAPGPGRLDLARTLFGAVSDEIAQDADQAQEPSRRSRVSFGDCRLADGITGILEAPAVFQRPTVLNGPKPSFYPNYIDQEKSGSSVPARGARPGDKKEYSTLMDDKAQLRGWKRYPVHNPASVTDLPTPPDKSKADVQTCLKPLRSGLRFEGRVRLHNVTREELGAIVWALSWGGIDTLRHSLGMGKPMGLGQVVVRLAPGSVQIRANDPTADAPTAQECQQAFESWMSRQNSRWQASLGELLAMANPAAPGTTQLVPLRLNAGSKDNEFKEAKKAGASLKPYSRPAPRR
jgi:CRISPR-associated protein (TIGR03986 family)